MAFKKSESLDFNSYNIMFRRRDETDYSAYCPQLNLQINGEAHEQVEALMKEEVYKHIEEVGKNKK